MIIELKDYEDAKGGGSGEKSNNGNIQENSNRKLFRVRNSIKDKKNKYYDVDIKNKTCTCLDFNFRKNKCKHIVATELYLV
jgi:SWIM zinc finger